jgi:hypothetical protein
MFCNLEFRCQADQLYFARHEIIEQDIGTSITIKISYSNIQVGSPTIDRCCCIAQAHLLRYGSPVCIVGESIVRKMRIVWQQFILQGENIQSPLLTIIEQQIGQAIASKVRTEFLVKRTGR